MQFSLCVRTPLFLTSNFLFTIPTSIAQNWTGLQQWNRNICFINAPTPVKKTLSSGDWSARWSKGWRGLHFGALHYERKEPSSLGGGKRRTRKFTGVAFSFAHYSTTRPHANVNICPTPVFPWVAQYIHAKWWTAQHKGCTQMGIPLVPTPYVYWKMGT